MLQLMLIILGRRLCLHRMVSDLKADVIECLRSLHAVMESVATVDVLAACAENSTARDGWGAARACSAVLAADAVQR